jgi:Rhamnan synthesis protein F
LQFFLDNNGIRDDIDYFFIINGECSVEIPNLTNITIIKRENKGFDFGSWANALTVTDLSYDFYIFINSSVIGPCLKNRNDWLLPFLELFSDSSDIGLVGTSIGFGFYPHVQSMFFILNKESIQYLINNTDVFNEEKLNSMTNINDIILNSEVGMSRAILKNGWNINCILSKYRGINYRVIKKDINSSSRHGDSYYPNAYFNKSIDRFEVIFYKSSRFPKSDSGSGGLIPMNYTFNP